MDRADHFRLRQHKQVVVAAQVTRVVVQAARGRATKIRLGQLVLLDHRAHGAVHDENAGAHEADEQGGAIGLH